MNELKELYQAIISSCGTNKQEVADSLLEEYLEGIVERENLTDILRRLRKLKADSKGQMLLEVKTKIHDKHFNMSKPTVKTVLVTGSGGYNMPSGDKYFEVLRVQQDNGRVIIAGKELKKYLRGESREDFKDTDECYFTIEEYDKICD